MSTKINSKIFLRPRFSIDFDKTSDELLCAFKDNLKDGDCAYCSKIVDEHIFIDVPEEENHFWSPQLHLEIEETPEGKALVKGLFGPKPQVWTLFIFIHFAIGIAFLIFLVVAYSKWKLNENAVFPIVMLIVLPLIWTLLYFLGRLGKSTGQQQMDELKSFMQETLEKMK